LGRFYWRFEHFSGVNGDAFGENAERPTLNVERCTSNPEDDDDDENDSLLPRWLRLIKRGVRGISDLTGVHEMLNVFFEDLNRRGFVGKFEGFI
jgi:hypothetical protein